MTRVDQIFEWCGWHREEWADGWHWVDREGHPVMRGDGDPSKNPSDCARVMDEVRHQRIYWTMEYVPEDDRYCVQIVVNRHDPEYQEWDGVSTSESEAKMNALLAMIEGRA